MPLKSIKSINQYAHPLSKFSSLLLRECTQFIIILLPASFLHHRQLMVFHWRLSDSKFSQIPRTLLSSQADLSNNVVWMVLTLLPILNSCSPFTNPLGIVPNAPIAIDITVTFMFHNFFVLWQCPILLLLLLLSFYIYIYIYIYIYESLSKENYLYLVIFVHICLSVFLSIGGGCFICIHLR